MAAARRRQARRLSTCWQKLQCYRDDLGFPSSSKPSPFSWRTRSLHQAFRGSVEHISPTRFQLLPSATGTTRASNWCGWRLMPEGHVGRNGKRTASQIFDSYIVSAINEKQHCAQDDFFGPSE